jgi:hypothetical protein
LHDVAPVRTISALSCIVRVVGITSGPLDCNDREYYEVGRERKELKIMKMKRRRERKRRERLKWR